MATTVPPDESAPTPASSPVSEPKLDDVLEQLDRQEQWVDKARASLEETIRELKLTPEEERVMAFELAQLRDLSRKLDEQTVEIAAFGMVSRGKSSVLNALLGHDVFKTGTTHGTTVIRNSSRWEQASAERTGLLGAKLTLVAVLTLATAPWYPILKAELFASLPGRSGFAVSLSSASGLAGGLGPLAVGLLAQRFGLNSAMAALCVAPAIMLVLVVPAGAGRGRREVHGGVQGVGPASLVVGQLADRRRVGHAAI